MSNALAADRISWRGAAVDESNSRGRSYAEPPPQYRSEFQRDRDRIIHSASFRRLEYKTQVFINHEGDMFRTRLTHSLEVAQIARTVARALGCNEDLTESIALGHDLGHSPFGHAGQKALNECLAEHGGFEHNLQSLRVVDQLENRYPKFPGLNLLFETREGLLKHCSIPNARRLGELGARFLEGRQPTLEAQICDVADAIAYNHHDIDDGIRSGLLDIAQLETIEPFATFCREYNAETNDGADVAKGDGRRATTLLRHTVIRKMINYFVTDLLATTATRLADLAPTSPDAVRELGEPVVAFSPPAARLHQEIKRFLFANLYHHPQVVARSEAAAGIVKGLFAHFLAHPDAVDKIARSHESLPRAAADYIAGMTDRFAIDAYHRIATAGDAAGAIGLVSAADT